MNNITNPDEFQDRCKHVLGHILLVDTGLEDCQAVAGAHQRSQHNTQEQTIVDLAGHLNGVTCTSGGLCCFAVLLDR